MWFEIRTTVLLERKTYDLLLHSFISHPATFPAPTGPTTAYNSFRRMLRLMSCKKLISGFSTEEALTPFTEMISSLLLDDECWIFGTCSSRSKNSCKILKFKFYRNWTKIKMLWSCLRNMVYEARSERPIQIWKMTLKNPYLNSSERSNSFGKRTHSSQEVRPRHYV